MNVRPSYDRLWWRRLDAFAAAWPGLLRGDAKALHKARVASRRIREALPVVGASAPQARIKELRRKMHDLTRFLGPIRELDVELGLLEHEAGASSVPDEVLEIVRREVASRRRALRHDLLKNPPVGDLKKLIHKLERVGKRAEGKEQRAEGRGKKKAAKDEGVWRGALAARLLRRAKALGASLEAAGPFYAADRIHGVRISTKRLRYALEIAHEAGERRAAAPIKVLQTHQKRLGRLHDHQVLLKHVRAVEASPGVGLRPTDVTAYTDFLERECRRVHADFVEHRDALIDCVGTVRHEIVPALVTLSHRQAHVIKPRRAQAKTPHGAPRVRAR